MTVAGLLVLTVTVTVTLTVTIDAAARAAGTIFRDCRECPEMVIMPFDASPLPRDAEPTNAGSDVPAMRRPGRFALGRFEVTFDEWEACVQAGGCRPNLDDHGWGRGRRPVINITYDDAQAYVAWLTAHTGHRYRLPTEAEWHEAHRAGTTTAFWWGDELGAGRANCRDCGTEWKGKGTAPVGSFAPNAYGLFDTAGNVWEWVADCWRGQDSSGPSTDPCAKRVIRGGAWYFVGKNMRANARFGNDARVRSYTIGLRVARDVP